MLLPGRFGQRVLVRCTPLKRNLKQGVLYAYFGEKLPERII
jgi:hypothetical protein